MDDYSDRNRTLSIALRELLSELDYKTDIQEAKREGFARGFFESFVNSYIEAIVRIEKNEVDMEKLETEAKEKAIKCLAKEFALENKYYKDLENASWDISYYLNLDYKYVENILNESNK